MAHYRKRPIFIEAMQLPLPGVDASDELLTFLLSAGDSIVSREDGAAGVSIVTPEGIVRVDPGDWVIKGVKGEFYPCKPDVFAVTYDVVYRGEWLP